MTELLEIAIKAHGGLDRWNKVNSIKVDASITGAIWYVKGKPDVLKDVVITAETKRERLTMELIGQDKRSILSRTAWLYKTHNASPSQRAMTRRGRLKARPWRRPGTTCRLPTSPAKRCGPT